MIKFTERQSKLVGLLRNRPSGLIRHEIADLMTIPLASVCSLANSLIKQGVVVETGATRVSPNGRSAGILAIADADGVSDA